jgi:hypothetical protein
MERFHLISQAYYTFLSALVSAPGVSNLNKEVLLSAVRVPLVAQVGAVKQGKLSNVLESLGRPSSTFN